MEHSNIYTEILHVRINGKIKKLLKKIAAEAGLSVSEYVRQLIYEELDKRTFKTALVSTVKKEL